jgi:hypothetical protein
LTIGSTEASAQFEAAFNVRNGNITTAEAVNGSFAVDRQSAIPGTTVTITASPNSNYALKPSAFLPNTLTFSRVNAVKYTFQMPAGMDVTVKGEFINPNDFPMATGGTLNIVDAGSGTFKEVHRFVYNSGSQSNGQTSYTLSFPGGISGLSSKVIAAAGGGGGGGSSNTGDGAGGGGAGGLIYNEAYTINGNISVKVGAGGAGGISFTTHTDATNASEGTSGKDSVFGTLTAKGGGGGGGGFNTYFTGKAGGSGGGGGSGTNNGTAGAGTSQQGNNGGVATVTSQLDAGGGGGGANGAGSNGGNGPGGAGGTGRTINSIPYWGNVTFCKGGNGGDSSSTAQSAPAAPTLYGEGGAAGPAGSTSTVANRAGKAGKEGVVIVWWDYIAP